MRFKIERILAVAIAVALIPGLARAESCADKQLALRPFHYALELSLDYAAQKLHGKCRLTVGNKSSEPCSTVPIILYRLLKVTSARDEKGQVLAVHQRIVEFEDWETLQVNFVTVDLGSAIGPGEEFALDLDYEGYLLGYSETGMLYVKDRIDEDFTIIRTDCYAYPRLGYPSWKVNSAAGLPDFDYELSVEAPKSMIVANGGRLIGRTESGDRAVTSYRDLKPSWRIDVALARYQVLENQAKGLRVFAFEADSEGAKVALDALARSMDLLASWFGPLKGESGFTLIETPAGYGGQADVTCILLTPEAFRDKNSLVQVYHEVSHLWNVKSLDPLPPRFESEGLATFLQYLLREKLDGKKDALPKGETRCLESVRKAFVKDPAAARTPMIEFGQSDLTDLSYTKGMLFLTFSTG